MSQVMLRCPGCNAEHYLHRAKLATVYVERGKTVAKPTGEWCECFCGCQFKALATGVVVLRPSAAQAQAAQAANGPAPAAPVAPEDRRPRPVLPKARP